MSEDKFKFLGMTADIVKAYVANNNMSYTDIPQLMSSVNAALVSAATGEVITASAEKPEPAVPIKKSVSNDFIHCLECGKKLRILKRHLSTDHGLSIQEYKNRWNLPDNYPTTAPAYAKARSNLAKELGLGRKRKVV